MVDGGGALNKSAADNEEFVTTEEFDGALLWFPEPASEDCL